MTRVQVFFSQAIGWIFCLLVFLVPVVFNLKTYDSAMIKIAIMQTGVLATIGFWVAKTLLSGRLEAPACALRILQPALLLLVWNLLSLLWNDYKQASAFQAMQYTAFLFTFLIAALELGEPFWSRRLWDWLVAGLAIVVVYGICQGIELDPLAWKGGFGVRIFSNLANPGLLGGYVSVLMPLVWLGLARQGDAPFNPRQIMSWILLAPACVCLAWTISFKPILATIVVGGVACVSLAWLWRKNPIFKPVFSGAFISLGIVLALSITHRAKLSEQAGYDLKFLRYTWASTLSLIKERPISGHGSGSFFVHYPRHRSPEIIRLENKHNTETDHPENGFLAVASDLGLVGVGLLFWLLCAIGAALWTCLVKLIHQGAWSDLAQMMGYALASLAVACLFMTDGLSARFAGPGWIYYCLLGLSAGLASRIADSSGKIWVYPLPMSPFFRHLAAFICLILVAHAGRWPIDWFKQDMEMTRAISFVKQAGKYSLPDKEAAQENYKQAIELWSQMSPGYPLYVMANYFTGNAYQDARQYDRAIEQYKKVKILAPHYVLVDYQMGNAYLKLGDFQNAIANFKEALKLDPIYAQTYRGLSFAYDQIGNKANSEVMRQKALELDPKIFY